jgi:NAD(P)H-nitrite reductase large subunit
MESTTYLIVGGGVAGTTAASTIRQHDSQGRIVILADELHPLYSRVALPSYLRGKTTYDRVFLKDAQFYDTQRIELVTGVRAVALDATEKCVTLQNGDRWGYESLLLATGAQPRTWHVPGAKLTGVLPLRTVDQATEIITRIHQAKHVTVVGGGFITLELLMTLAQEGVATSVIIREPYYWASLLDEESGILIQSLLNHPHIDFYYSTEVEQVLGDLAVTGVLLSNGKRLKTDLVLANIGVQADLGWLEQSGLGLAQGIETDACLKTTLPEIYAAGDVANYFDPILNMRHMQGNWLNATIHGRTAGLSMVGQPQPSTSVSTYSISVFGKNIAFVGYVNATSSMVVIPRGSARSGSYGRILLQKGRMVGATLINRFADKEPLSRLIASGLDMSMHHGLLADETVSLKELADQLLRGD